MSNATIRPAVDADLAALTDLYNHYIETSPATFDLAPYSLDARREWMSHYDTAGAHRLLVAEVAGHVRGYASSSRFRPKAAYDTSVEVTVYLDPEAQGKGLGRQLYTALFGALEGEDVHRAFAGVTVPNEASVGLHRAFAFESIGIFEEAGRKFGRFWSVEWFQKRLR